MTDMFDGGLPHVRPLRNSIINGLQRTYATIMDDFDELGGESADGFISNRVQAFELLGNFMAERPEFQSFGADAHQSNVFYFSQNACAADIIIQAHMVGEMHAGPERTHAMYRLQQLVNYTEEKHGLFKTDEMIVAMDTVEAVATRVKSEEKMIATWNRVKSALKPW